MAQPITPTSPLIERLKQAFNATAPSPLASATAASCIAGVGTAVFALRRNLRGVPLLACAASSVAFLGQWTLWERDHAENERKLVGWYMEQCVRQRGMSREDFERWPRSSEEVASAMREAETAGTAIANMSNAARTASSAAVDYQWLHELEGLTRYRLPRVEIGLAEQHRPGGTPMH